MTSKNILVLGCGVIGLTTGITLLKEGYGVSIFAKAIPPNTTSNAAGAFWYPYLHEPVSSLGNQLAFATRDYVYSHILHLEEAGAVERVIEDYYQIQEEAPHADAVKFPDFQVIAPHPNFKNCLGGVSFQTFVVDTDIYLDFLLNDFKRGGGKVVEKDFSSFDEVLNIAANSDIKYSAIVNCSGLGAKLLANDDTMFPIRGQTLLVKSIPNIDRLIFLNDEDGTYVIPRKTNCVIGGTFQYGNYSEEPSQEDTDRIMRKVALLAPIGDVEIIKVKVGLRPGRKALFRLDSERIPIPPSISSSPPSPSPSSTPQNILVVHNYGHSSRGFTLSWGCAQKVAGTLKETLVL